MTQTLNQAGAFVQGRGPTSLGLLSQSCSPRGPHQARAAESAAAGPCRGQGCDRKPGARPAPTPQAEGRGAGGGGSGLGTLPPPAPAPRGRRAHHGGVRTRRVLAARRRTVPVPTESPEPGRPAPDPKMVVRRRIRDKGPSKTAKARPLLSVSSPDCTFLVPAPSIGQSFSSHRLRP